MLTSKHILLIVEGERLPEFLHGYSVDRRLRRLKNAVEPEVAAEQDQRLRRAVLAVGVNCPPGLSRRAGSLRLRRATPRHLRWLVPAICDGRLSKSAASMLGA